VNRDLEELLRAYDSARQAGSMDEKHLLAVYESKLAEILERHPGLSRVALEAAVHRPARPSGGGKPGEFVGEPGGVSSSILKRIIYTDQHTVDSPSSVSPPPRR